MSITTYTVSPLLFSANVGAQSSPITVAPVGGVFNPSGNGQTITAVGGSVGDRFFIASNATVIGPTNTNTITFQPTASAPSFSFTINPAIAGPDSITFLNNQAWEDSVPAYLIATATVQVNILTLNVSGLAQANVTIYFQMTGVTDSRLGQSYPAVPLAGISNNLGIVSVNLPQNSIFQIWRKGFPANNVPLITTNISPVSPVTLIGGM